MVSDKFRMWLLSLSAPQKRHLAENAGTSAAMLRQLVTGHRNASNELAARIEYSAKGAVNRADLNDECRQCSYYKRCSK